MFGITLFARRLKRDFITYLQTLLSLVVGLCSTILVGLFVDYYLSYDRYNQNPDHIYRVVQERINLGTTELSAITSSALGPLLKQDFGDIVEYVRLAPNPADKVLFRGNDKSFYWQNVYTADESILRVFSHDIIYGNPDRALKSLNSLAVSTSFARAYFGNDNPIGKTVSTDSGEYKIDLVFKDQPENTHVKYDVLNGVPDNWRRINSNGRMLYYLGLYTYVLVNDGFEDDDVKLISNTIFNQYMADNRPNPGESANFYFEPLADIHLNSKTLYDLPRDSALTVYLGVVIGLLILIATLVNYLNLMMAHYFKRSKEIGIRKILGVGRLSLLLGFWGESFIIILSGFLTSLGLVHVILDSGSFNGILDFNEGYQFVLQGKNVIWMSCLIIVLAAASTSVPVLHLIRVKPLLALSHGNASIIGKALRIRTLLMGIQFVATMTIVVCAALTTQHVSYLTTKPLGFNKQQKLIVPLYGADTITRFSTLKGEIEKIAGVQAVAISEHMPTSTSTFQTTVSALDSEGQVRRQSISHMNVGADFTDILEISLLHGRPFQSNAIIDSDPGVLINRTFAEAWGWDNPIGQQIDMGSSLGKQTVRGVVEDFHFQGLHQPVEPLVLRQYKPNFDELNALQKRRQKAVAIVSYTDVNVGALASEIGQQWDMLFGLGRPFEYNLLTEILDRQYISEARQQSVLSIIALISITLACVGAVSLGLILLSQKAKEFALRKILGATTLHIVTTAYKHLLYALTLSALIATLLSHWLITLWISNSYYHAEISYLSIVFIISSIIGALLLSLYIQCRRYTNVSPSVYLKN